MESNVSAPSKKNIFVTGGSGLIGKELITQLLSRGQNVTAIYNKTPLDNLSFEGLQAIQCNILDVIALDESMENMDEVYHCAAIVKFDGKNEKELFKINVEGTANVVNAALNAGVKKFVYVSSAAALGRIREDHLINEEMRWTEETSNSIYGKSKYLGEMEVWRAAGEGLNVVIVNPVIVLGPGNWDNGSSKIFKSVYDEFPWYTEGTSGFVDVRDVAAAMIQLMESNVSNERFILSGANRSYKELFTIIAKAFGKRAPYKKASSFLAELIWRAESVKSLFTGKGALVTKETAAAAMAKVNFDNSKLNKFLPAFTYRPIEDTITYTCNALQQKLNNR